MITTVSGYTIDVSQLVCISKDDKEGDWGWLVVPTMKPELQYVKNPDTNELELLSLSNLACLLRVERQI